MLPFVERLSKRRINVVWAAILAIGVAGGIWGWRGCRGGMLSGLSEQARRCAAAIQTEDVKALSGTRQDTGNPAYVALKRRLADLKAGSPNARFVFLVRSMPPTGRIVFLADSEPPSQAAMFRPGDDYSDAMRLPALQRALQAELPASQGPNSDSSGDWAVGFAPLAPPESPGAGAAPREILGVDISAGGWTEACLNEALVRAVGAWAILGLPFGILLILRRQKEQGKAIRNLLTAMEQSHSAVMIVDTDGHIEYVNTGLCAQFGYSRRELLGKPWKQFLQADAPADLAADMFATVRAGSPWRGEWSNKRKGGENYPVRATVSPVTNRDASLSCFVALFEDMSEVRLAEENLKAALNRAEAGDRAKGQFLATMSHEMRTPLNGIVGFTSLLLETPLTPEQSEYVQIIRTSGTSLIQLTGDILDLAQIESGSLKLELQSCDPRACVENTLDLLAVQAAEKNVELLHWIDEDVPATILADTNRLTQVLVNFAGNAVKFTEAGEIELTVRAEKDGTGWILKFAVRDTGMGIAPEDHDRLFKPFSQLDVSTTRRHGGTGLGLAISKNLVELMGGKVSVDSIQGTGSTFTFTIRAAGASGPARAVPGVRGLRVALAAHRGPFRSEFARLAQRWQVQLVEVGAPIELSHATWDVAFVEVNAELAQALALQPTAEESGEPPRWPVERTHAIAPVSLAHDLRTSLKRHFRQVINKPLHHDAMLAMLAGIRSSAASDERAPEHFDLNVLVAEDNVVNQKLVQKLLWNLGCASTVAENGTAVLEELASSASRYDLVLMDLHMPELDGLTAIEKIRAGAAGESMRNIWVAALTADARAEQRKRVLAAGGNDYIVKPVKLGDLADGLRRFVEARRRNSAASAT